MALKPIGSHRELRRELMGLVPAGGEAARIAPLPCSKELYPVGYRSVDNGSSLRPKVACHYLLERMRLAGTRKAYVILRAGKWDIPGYFADGKMLDMNLAYLMMDLPFGVPYTLDQAYPFVSDAMVVFGFPDIIFRPNDAFAHLLARQAASESEIVLGLFPARQPHKMDMVDLDKDGGIRSIVIKPIQTDLHYTWIIAVWTPGFTEFLHQYLLARQLRNIKEQGGIDTGKHSEMFLGHVIQAALEKGIYIDSVIFNEADYLDIGTPEDLVMTGKHAKWVSEAFE